MNILVLRLSSLGDVLLSTPVYRLLRKKFPSARIDVVTKKEYAEVLRHNPHISSVIEFVPTKEEHHFASLRAILLQNNYDAVFDLHNSIRTRILRKGIAKSIFVVRKNVFKRFLLVKFKINFYKNILSVPEKYIQTLSPLGIENDDEGLEIFTSQETEINFRNKFAQWNIPEEKRIIAIAPTARHFTKIWLAEKYAELTNALILQQKAFVVLLGAANESTYCENIVQQLDNNSKHSVLNLAGNISLPETALCLDKSACVVTNDSAMLHLASARKKNIVAIFGSSVKEFGFFPYRTNAVVLENTSLSCRPCSHIGLSKCPKKHFRCMNDISVASVMSEVENF